MDSDRADWLADVARYYAGKLGQFGDTARGVDWNGPDSQQLRFAQLCRILPAAPEPFSLNDLGCGYGALLDYLDAQGAPVAYCGIDVAAEMVRAAQARHGGRAHARFVVAAAPAEAADYGIASGIFNVRLARSDDEWSAHVDATLDALDRTSRRGFAFNCLTSYSDPALMRDDLHYADPCRLFDRCKRRYSRHVALLHDYGLYEFTVLVRKG